MRRNTCGNQAVTLEDSLAVVRRWKRKSVCQRDGKMCGHRECKRCQHTQVLKPPTKKVRETSEADTTRYLETAVNEVPADVEDERCARSVGQQHRRARCTICVVVE